ncbi:hypothetical protein MKX83_02940 [Cytobacillus sp. FSL M8-0252]|uniref:hypothetical protein n=1 Tax=Cytobacillus sp. FSL M8-0252 TaxID=2921621 RepID=UPI0030F4E114
MFSFGNGVTTFVENEIIAVEIIENVSEILVIKLKNGKAKKNGPLIRLHEPFTWKKEEIRGTISYKFYKGKQLILLCGYVGDR